MPTRWQAVRPQRSVRDDLFLPEERRHLVEPSYRHAETQDDRAEIACFLDERAHALEDRARLFTGESRCLEERQEDLVELLRSLAMLSRRLA